MGGRHDGIHVFQHAIVVGALDIDGSGSPVQRRLDGGGVGGAAVGRHHDHGHFPALAVGLDDRDGLGICCPGDDHGRALALLAHEHGFRRRHSAVIDRRIGHVHAGQLAHLGLILKDRLQHALADLRLIGGVSGQKFFLGRHRLHDGGDIVAVSPGAPEHRGEHPVLCSQLGHLLAHLQLAQALRQIQALHPDALRDHVEQLVGGGQTDGLEHGLPLFPGGGNVAAHAYASSAATTAS